MAEFLEDPGEVINQSLQGWFGTANSRKDTHVSGHSQAVSAETKRLAKPPFESVARDRRPGCLRDENAIPELFRGLPDKGKKIGRKPLPLVEKRIDLDPAFQARRAWKLTFSDQSLPPTVCGP
jgi:hypothetical protein